MQGQEDSWTVRLREENPKQSEVCLLDGGGDTREEECASEGQQN